jgi:2Fe-2S ferredoxin
MGKATFIDRSGNPLTVDIANGTSLMQASLDHNIDGIVAECGGQCSCATCHVYVDDAWYERAGAPSDREREMLECVIDPGPTSRLSCQVAMNDELDGIVVRVADKQY